MGRYYNRRLPNPGKTDDDNLAKNLPKHSAKQQLAAQIPQRAR